MKTKQITKILICLCVMLALCLAAALTVSAEGGTGTETDPILIGTLADYNNFVKRVNENGETDLCAKLTADIVLNAYTFTFMPDTGLICVTYGIHNAYIGTGIAGDASGGSTKLDTYASKAGGWYTAEGEMGTYNSNIIITMCSPIGGGFYNRTYNGTFDGDGHTISGFFANSSDREVGLFGKSSGIIKNVGVKDSCFISSNANSNVGGICAYNTGDIIDCYNAGIAISIGNVGGICGNNDSGGNISGSYNTGAVRGTNAGGIYSVNSDTVTYCYYLDTSCVITGGSISKTAEEFASGEVTYLLNGSRSEGTTQDPLAWFQTCGTGYPAFSGDTVYYSYADCEATAKTYVNNPHPVEGHDYSNNNGICVYCGGYQPATQIDGSNYSSFGFAAENWSAYNGYYAITNAGNLYWFAEQVNAGNTSYNAVLTENITLNPGTFDTSGVYTPVNSETPRQWTPIGTISNNYAGTFDGNGHTVSGIYTNSNGVNKGLFGINGGSGQIKNVGAINSYIIGFANVGAVCGANKGTVTNCYNTGTVVGEGNNVGGICGCNGVGAEITRCYNTGAVFGDTGNSNCVGGICGENAQGNITHCYNTGAVAGYEEIGGVCGWQTEAEEADHTIIPSITNCYSTGAVSGTIDIGGVCGMVSNGTVTNCYYLTGCAKDGSNTVQFGIGNNTAGSTTPDTSGSTAGKTSFDFSSGAVAWLLNLDSNGNQLIPSVWYQTIGTGGDAFPTLDSTHGTVYRSYTYDADGFGTAGYTNTQGATEEYQPATQIDVSNYSSFGFAAENWSAYNGYYAITNAGNLYWFAAQVNVHNDRGINAVLTADITLNDETFAFYPDTGLVYVADTEGHTAYLGTGIAGDASGGNTVFDTTASIAGALYDAEGNLLSGSYGGTLRKWTPIGNSDSIDSDVFKYYGIFDGRGHTVSGLYINDPDSDYQGLFGHIIAEGGITGTVRNLGVTGGYINGDSNIGGVAGVNNGTVERCYNTCIVTGNVRVGGIAGSNHSGSITDCYNTGTLYGNVDVGGVAGRSQGTITNCYNTGTLNALYGMNAPYGIANNTGGSVENCYYLEAFLLNPGGGEPKSSSEFSSGEVAYLLNRDSYDNQLTPSVWYQNLSGDDVDTYPTLNSTHGAVYNGYIYDADGFGTAGYTNIQGATEEYQPATQIDGSNYSSFGFKVGNWSAYNSFYVITNAGNLYWFAAQVNAGNTGYNAVLTKNIALNDETFTFDPDTGLVRVADTENHTAFLGTGINSTTAGAWDTDYPGALREWTPIGTATNIYTGIFDGNNKTVGGIYINSAVLNHVGLFGYVSGTVKKLGVSGGFVFGKICVGGICAAISQTGIIESCYNAGIVTGAESSMCVGGICGVFIGDFAEDCYNTGTVSGNNFVGGVCGNHSSANAIRNCYNTGTVSGVSYVGGVCGGNQRQNYSGKMLTMLDSCYNTGAVSGSSGVGGVCGLLREESITSCYNTGAVSGKIKIGGVCGSVVGNIAKGIVEKCGNTAEVRGEEQVGGICGGIAIDRDGEPSVITGCYNSGTVVGVSLSKASTKVGGVCGENSESIIENSYNTGTVSGDSNVGGVCGNNAEGTITNCYYLGTSETDELTGTTFKTALQFSSGEVAWLLNTSGGTAANSKIWAQGADYPVFADAANKEIVRLRFTGAKEQSVYLKSGEVLPALSELTHAVSYTAGETITEDTEITVDLNLASAAPLISDSIAIKYTAVIGDALRAGTTPSVKFTFRGSEITVSGDAGESADGYTTYTFTFRGILPQFMCENISAELTIGGATVSKSTYSVRDYSLRILGRTAEEMEYSTEKCDAFKRLVVDMLYYGADSQKYIAAQNGITLDETALATYGLSPEQIALRTADKTGEAAKITSRITPTEGEYTAYKWDTATVVLTDRISFRFKLTAPDITGLTVKVYIGSASEPVETISAFTPTGTANQYQFDFSAISASQLGENVRLEMYKGETAIGSNLTYSMNSYIRFAMDRADFSNELKALMRSIYGYELTAAAFISTP